MLNNKKEDTIFDEFDAICQKLDSYDNINNLIRRKIELFLKILNSDSFKKNIYLWGMLYPQELISIYNACNSEDGFVITYGTTILGGSYLDFCQSFSTSVNNRYTQKYNITNLKTSEQKTIELDEIIKYYSARDYKNFKVDVAIVRNEEDITTIPLITNDFIMENGNVKYGIIKVDLLIKQFLPGIIDEFFDIRTVETSANKLDNNIEDLESLDKVVPIFANKNKIANV